MSLGRSCAWIAGGRSPAVSTTCITSLAESGAKFVRSSGASRARSGSDAAGDSPRLSVCPVARRGYSSGGIVAGASAWPSSRASGEPASAGSASRTPALTDESAATGCSVCLAAEPVAGVPSSRHGLASGLSKSAVTVGESTDLRLPMSSAPIRCATSFDEAFYWGQSRETSQSGGSIPMRCSAVATAIRARGSTEPARARTASVSGVSGPAPQYSTCWRS